MKSIKLAFKSVLKMLEKTFCYYDFNKDEQFKKGL